MNDSSNNHDDFVNRIIADRDAFQAEQDKIKAQEEAEKSIARGALTQAILGADLDLDDLTKVTEFIKGGCEFEQVIIVDNDGDSTELKAKLSATERDNDELRKENERLSSLDGDLILAFTDEDEFKKAQAILRICANGGGKFIDPGRVENALKPKEQKREQKGPSRPPTTPLSKDDKSSKSEKKSFTDKLLGK